MTRLVTAEFRKLLTTRVWWWILLISVAWTIVYTAIAIALDKHPGHLMPSLSGAVGQHALFSTAAGIAGTLVAVMATAEVAGEYRHGTAVATFLATPHRQRVVIAQVITFLMAGIGYALACVLINLAVAVPWLAARGIHFSAFGDGNFAVLASIVLAGAFFGAIGAGIGAILHSQLATVAAMLLYLYVLEPLLSHIASLNSWTPYLPGVAADSLTQDIQNGVRLLSPWAGGLVLAGWAIAFVIAGAMITERTDIT
jgi:ABC-type transport system involved in multi-copper enzyme maturation permease subunit